MIRYACKWESYTLLRLNSSCGTTTYTRRSRYSQDHYTRELQCPRIMATSEERASKKAKTVDNESGTSKDCTGTSVPVPCVDFLPRVAAVRRRPCTTTKMHYRRKNITYRAHSYYMTYKQYTRSCCLLVCGPEKQEKNGQKTSRGVTHETDGQTLRSLFLMDNHYLVLA